MDFDKRLERAITRGQRTRDAEAQKSAEKALSEEELKALHSKVKLEFSEHIEDCLRRLSEHFPGFQYQTVVGEAGWGAKIARDDLQRNPGRPASNVFSRLEMVIAPYSPSHIVSLSARGTIRNRDVITRSHYQQLDQLDRDSFKELIDLWVLEYAEKFAAAE